MHTGGQVCRNLGSQRVVLELWFRTAVRCLNNGLLERTTGGVKVVCENNFYAVDSDTRFSLFVFLQNHLDAKNF